MRNGCKKILKSRQGSTQGRLDSFFSITGSLSSKRKEPELKGSAKKKQKTGATPVEVPELLHVCFSFLLCAYLVTSVMAVQSVRMVTANMLLSVFLVSGALADCKDYIDLFMAAPQQMEALTGSCLQIPCTFSTKSEEGFNSSRTTFGVWMKDAFDFVNKPQNVIFNSSRESNIYPMTLTGDLSHKNCTTLFSSVITSYTGTYFFRIENRLFLSTARCDPLRIRVTGDQQSERVGAQVIVKTLGIIMLVGTLVIFECWFRSRRSSQPQKCAEEADYVNSVVEVHPS